jgi:cell division septum initiation protein DivIVA
VARILREAADAATNTSRQASAERARILEEAEHLAEQHVLRERKRATAEVELVRAQAAETAARTVREAAATADRMVAKAQRDAEAMLEQGRAEFAALWDDVRQRRQQSEEAARRVVTDFRAHTRPPGSGAGPGRTPPTADPSKPSHDVAARLIDEAFGETRSRRDP